MITKAMYEALSSGWKGKIYQKWKKLKKRMPMIKNNLDFFEGAKVLELGSNAGMYGYLLYPYLSFYTGIEVNKSYFEQSIQTLKGKDVILLNNRFKDVVLSRLDYDLFIASYVLHHLDEEEVEKLNEVFEHCNKVAIHTRSGDPLKYGHDEVGFDPVPKWENSRIKKMLELHGFKFRLILSRIMDYNGTYLILAEK